jgi:hypothetical protein
VKVARKDYVIRNHDLVCEKKRTHYYQNREALLKQKREFQHSHPEVLRERNIRYRQSHRETVGKYGTEYSRKWRSLNPKKAQLNARLSMSRWRKRYPERARMRSSLHRLDRDLRIPRWANLPLIEKFYAGCPPGFVVDHIIPLKGKLVSGLHVLSNLQYLTRKENSVKSNKFPY